MGANTTTTDRTKAANEPAIQASKPEDIDPSGPKPDVHENGDAI